MTRELVAQWIGWLAVAAFFARLVPQPVKLWRTGLPHGVSPLAALNNLITDVGWVLYGTMSGTTQVWLTAAVALVPGLWTVVLLRGETNRRHVVPAAAWMLIVLATWPLHSLGSVLAISVAVNHGPQVAMALRRSDLRGISVATWCLAIADASLWGCFGALRPEVDVALVGYGVALLTAALLVLARVAWTRRSASLDPAVALTDTALEGLAYTPAS